MLRRALLGVSRSETIKSFVTRAPIARDVVARYVAGESAEDAVRVASRLVAAGLAVSVDHLGEDTVDIEQADRATIAYVDLLARLLDAGLADRCEVSVKLSAVGLLLGEEGQKVALENAELICGAACNAGTRVTVDMEDHTTTDATLAVAADLRKDFPSTGVVLQSYLHRTEGDCRELAEAGVRVRLCKGAYDEPGSVAFRSREEVDRSYVRCLRILLEGPGYPMIATHDPRLIEIASSLVTRTGRPADSYEFQMLYGVRPTEQQRLANGGQTMRIYLPYGTDWYGYLIRRLAERPANVTFFTRSLMSKG